VRRRLGILAALLLATASAAPAAGRHPWTEPGHLRIGVVRTIDTLDPLLTNQAAVADLAQFIFSGLVRTDENGELVPDAATVVPTQQNGGISRDGKTIVYHIRPNVTFSDGVPLSANDVVFTFRQIMNPRNNVALHFPYDQAQSVVAKDAHTVVVRLKAPFAPFVVGFFLCGARGSILPEHLLRGKADLNKDPFNLHPIGSGPYMVQSYEPNSRLEMVANPHWFAGKPGLQRVTYRIIPSENTLLVALQTHDIDFYFAAPEQQYRQLRSFPGVTVSAKPFNQFEQLAFGAGRAPFDDVRLRRAVARAIDFSALARTDYLGIDLPDWGDVFPRSWAYTPQRDPNGYDPAAARKLLDAAGWKPGPDGIRVRDGHRLSVDIATVAGVIPRENAEVVIQQQLHAVGIDVQVHNSPANLLFATEGAGGLLASAKFDLAIYAWTKFPDPDDTDTSGPGSLPPYGANFSRVVDRELGRLQREAESTYDRKRRKALYAQIERRIGDVLPYHTIVWRANVDAWNDDLHGVRPAQATSDFWNVGTWTI